MFAKNRFLKRLKFCENTAARVESAMDLKFGGEFELRKRRLKFLRKI